MSTRYVWKPKSQISVDAQVAGEELDRIRVRNNGQLSQEAVVAEAKDAGNPLHPAFEWRDKVAAHQYRLEQARYIIRQITVVTAEDNEGKPAETIRAFVSVRPEDEPRPAYVSVTDAMADPVLRQQVLANALRELAAIRQKYREYAELADVFAAVDKLIAAA